MELTGKWWIPDRKKESVYGNISIEIDNTYKLDASSEFKNIATNDFLQKYPVVHGISKGDKYTLINTDFRGKTSNIKDKTIEVRYEIGEIVKNDLITNITHPRYTECTFSCTFLSFWMQQEYIDFEENEAMDELKVKLPSENKVLKVGELDIYFEKNYSLNHNFNPDELQLKAHCQIRIVSKVFLTLDKLYEKAQEIVDLITFSIGIQSEITFFHLRKKDTDIQTIEYLLPQFMGENDEQTALINFLIDFERLDQNLIDSWFNLKKGFPMLVILFLANLNNREQYLEHEFFNYSTALDHYFQNSTKPNIELIPKTEFNTIKKALKATLDKLNLASEIVGELKGKLVNLNKKSFQTSILEAYDVHANLHGKYHSDKNELAKDASEIRNTIAHGKKLPDPDLLLAYTHYLQYFLTVVILDELDFDDKYIGKILDLIVRYKKA